MEISGGGLGVEEVGSHIAVESEESIEVSERFFVVASDVEVLGAEMTRAEEGACGGGGVGGLRGQA